MSITMCREQSFPPRGERRGGKAAHASYPQRVSAPPPPPGGVIKGNQQAA